MWFWGPRYFSEKGYFIYTAPYTLTPDLAIANKL